MSGGAPRLDVADQARHQYTPSSELLPENLTCFTLPAKSWQPCKPILCLVPLSENRRFGLSLRALTDRHFTSFRCSSDKCLAYFIA